MTLREQVTQKRWLLLGGLAVLLVAAGVGSFAAFSATTQNASNLSANPDWTPPTVNSQVLAATTSGVANHVKPGEQYNVYANVSDSGNPAAGVASVSTDVGGLSAGAGSAALSAGSFSFGGTSYGRRTANLTADATIPACRYTYPITATDSASPPNSATQTGQKAMVDRDLASDYNIRIDGEMSGGRGGYSIAGAGDVNGDGRPDALIGAIDVGRDTRTTAGSVYVVFGQSSPTNLDLASLGSQGYRIDGLSSADLTGAAVANAGDVNGDGKADALVGASGGDDAFVIWGKATTTNVDLNAIGSQGYRIDGAASTTFGVAVANVGDVNGDGRPDALIGAEAADNNGRSNSGSAYVIFGKTSTTAVSVTALGTQGYRIDGAVAGESLGRGVSDAGDVNGDGKADMVVGSYLADANARTNSGSAYVVFGKSADTNPIDLAALGTGGYRIDGAAANSSTGFNVAKAGDVNGDATPDALIGAYQADNNARTNSGSTYVVFGKSSDTSTIDLAALGTGGYRIDGATANDEAGTSVESAGDLNGDGTPDALIGAPLADFNSRTLSGSAYVVFGKSSNTSPIDLAALGTQGYRIDGAAATDRAGRSVANGGDVDGDGKPDVLVGAIYVDGTNREAVGAGYVVYGKATTSNIDLNALGTGGYRMLGEGAAGQTAWSLATAGDVNGDGREDAVIGAYNRDRDDLIDPGAAYVVFGQASPTNVDLGALGTTGYRIDGAAAADFAGYRVTNAGDVNGDGNDDTLVGAYQADHNSRTDSGSAYVVFGKASTTPVSLTALGAGGYRIDGAAASDNTGISISSAGDVNGDGTPDQVIGAYRTDANGRSNSGTAFVVFGKATTTNIDLNALGAQGYRINGAVASDNAGRMVANAGDVNGDGRPDALVGAPLADNNARTDSGSAYVVWGKADNAAIDLAALGTQGYRIDAVAAADNLGWSLAGAGDVNGDGRVDTIVGANTADHNGRSSSGSAYVVFGKTDNAAIDLAALGTQGYRIDGAAASDNAGYWLENAGDVNGDGTDDVLVGSPLFNKPGASDSGAAYVVFGKATTTNVDLLSPGLAAYRIDGGAISDQAGYTAASAGDVNGDGRADFLIGARYADTGGADGGAAYIRYSPPCSYSNTVLATSGLLGYWHLNESTGTAAADSEGSNDGAYEGGTTQGVGDALRTDDDQAASFDGNDDRVTISSIGGFPSTAISAEFWMRSSDTTKLGTPLSYASTAGSNDFLVHNYNNLAVHVAGAQLSTGVAANDGSWHHIAVTWQSSNGHVRLYKDGVLAFSQTGLSTGGSITSGGTLMFGQEQDSVGGGIDPNQAFLGSLDEVAVSDRVLTAVEVQDHYDAR